MIAFDPWAALAAAETTLANSRNALAPPAKGDNTTSSAAYTNPRNSRNSRNSPSVVSQARGESSKERKKEDIYILQGLTRGGRPPGEPDGSVPSIAQDDAPARVAILREFSPSCGQISGNGSFRPARVNRPEIAVPGPSDILRAPLEWRDGFACLSSTEPACPGFRLSLEWQEVHAACYAFLEQHAEAAHSLGWTALDLFAVHHVVGATRVDCCGALMVSAGSQVSAVEPDVIQYVRARDGQPCGRFFRRPHTPEMVLAWSFDQ